MSSLTRYFEWFLWHSRLLILVAVLASLVVAAGMFFVSTVDAWHLIASLGPYADPGLAPAARASLRAAILTDLVEVVDGYLLAAVLIIFALGLYELFVDKIDLAEGSDIGKRLLLVRSLDDLKDRLAQVILLILVVKFFQAALQLKYLNSGDLVLLAFSVLVVSAALYLSGRIKVGKPPDNKA